MWEKELLGLFVTSHPLEEYRTMEKKCLKITRVKENPAARLVKIGGMISTVKKIITKTGKPMIFMNLEDLTDKIEVVVFASAMEKNPAVFAESKVVLRLRPRGQPRRRNQDRGRHRGRGFVDLIRRQYHLARPLVGAPIPRE